MPQVSGSNDAVPWPRTPPIAFEYRRPVADDPSPDDWSNISDSDSDSDSDLSDEAQSRLEVIFYPSIDLVSRDAWGSPDDGVVVEAETQYMELDTQITYPRRSVAVQEIPMTAVGAAEMARGVNCCAVCVEDYTEGEQVSRLPCGHCFHKDCISPWLQTRVTCPICRFKLV